MVKRVICFFTTCPQNVVLVQFFGPAFNESISTHADWHLCYFFNCVNLPPNLPPVIYGDPDTSLTVL